MVIEFVSRKEIRVNGRGVRARSVGAVGSDLTRLQIIFDHRVDINSRLSKIIVDKFFMPLGRDLRGTK